jgi:hypothetical protein
MVREGEFILYILVNNYNTNLMPLATSIIRYLVCEVLKAWDQEVCSLCGLRFEPRDCLYDGYWRLTWSLTSGPVGLVKVRASWPGHPR